MRKLLFIITFLIVTGFVISAGVFLWGYQQYTGVPGPYKNEIILVIKKGSGVSEIASTLEQRNIISSALLFRIAAKITGKETRLKAGEYAFWPELPMEDVMAQLVSGSVYQRFFTIPEGLTSWQIVQLLNATGGLDGVIKDIPKEGSLLPETYNFVKGDTRQDKILQMQAAMKEAVEEVWYDKPKDAPLLSIAEGVILASIVEKETALPSERRRIAGVFHNRLKKGMMLQTDPTVIYALTKGEIKNNGKGPLGRRLLTKDLKFDSPYNTYKYPGLPPGPIANPGRASLEAVINPERHGYYYFVADGTGGHAFSKTLEEHNRSVAKWRKIRRSQQKN